MKEKSLYISGYDKNGIFRFSIPAGGQIPAGIIIGKRWTLKTEYKINYKCSICGTYLFTEKAVCPHCN